MYDTRLLAEGDRTKNINPIPRVVVEVIDPRSVVDTNGSTLRLFHAKREVGYSGHDSRRCIIFCTFHSPGKNISASTWKSIATVRYMPEGGPTRWKTYGSAQEFMTDSSIFFQWEHYWNYNANGRQLYRISTSTKSQIKAWLHYLCGGKAPTKNTLAIHPFEDHL